MKKDDVTPYIRFLKSIQKPDLEGVWLDGRDCAENRLTLEDNPYSENSKEYFYWNEGWWAGFYEEDQIGLFNSSTSAVMSNVVSLKVANDSLFKGKQIINEWVENISFIMGTFMTGFLCYELVDIVL